MNSKLPDIITKRLILLIAVIFLFTDPMQAWDEVTHAFITEKIIEEINIPELQQLLEYNKAEFLSGCWFTDSYQYTSNRISALNPHHLDIYSNAYLSYLQKDAVKGQENYEKLVALFFGSIAHTTEDFWLDNLLLKYPVTIGENISGDIYNGVIAINKYNYLNKKVLPFFPASDLFTLYTDAGMIEAEYDTREKFEKVFGLLINKQYEQLRLLKLLSFLASNQVQNESPWVSANIMTAPGGILSCTRNTARYLEATWLALNGVYTEGVLNREFTPLENKLGMLLWLPQPVIEKEQLEVIALNSEQDTVPGYIGAFSFGGTKTRLVNLVYQFDDGMECEEGIYLASVAIKNNEPIQYNSSFEVSIDIAGILEPQQPHSFISSMGTGLFLFILCLGIAGVFWGLSGVYPFILATRQQMRGPPRWNHILQKGLQVIGASFLGLGFYLLVTRGWIVVLNV